MQNNERYVKALLLLNLRRDSLAKTIELVWEAWTQPEHIAQW
jgi:hypothetical protein